ncbi:hypothetical protein BJX63DRAFT_440792 [Aspergillus granulosus]|uniref:Mid2 domain-containing protein n=1 Tax=Aspergillus granulosus TaxID=176169 RepID=A0ABR4GU28_9EURO
MSGNFTFPTEDEYQFIVADLVNITWDVVAPVVSLYESCGSNDRVLEEQVSNNYSYVWTATRKDYVESGCNFMLQPFTSDYESYGNNITSVTFGVSKRYTSDPAPASYNFVNESSSSLTTFTTTVSASTLATVASPETPSPTSIDTSASESNPGLSTAAKIGVGLGVPLGVLLLATAVVALIIYRRRQRRQGETREIQGGIATGQLGDELSPLPTLGYKDSSSHMRLSVADTIATTPSQMSSENYYQRMVATERPRSELMSAERAELA